MINVGCGQSYKASMIVINESRVVNMSNFLVTTIYKRKLFIRLTTEYIKFHHCSI